MPEWLWQRDESPARKLALSPLLLAEGGYRLGAWIHRTAYRTGLLKRHRVAPRVICVGNLAVGGSGKTPLVAWLARELHARGRKLAILSRGVGGSRMREVSVVSDGERLRVSTAEVGDEPVLLASLAPGTPVLAGRNRTALALRAAAMFGVEALIVDDGFQHHRLARDVDLVCVDAALGLGNGHVLPRGPLRESPRVLRLADAIIWTRAPLPAAPASAEAGAAPGEPPARPLLPAAAAALPAFAVAIEPSELSPLGERGARPEPVDALAGAKVGMLAAIARPDRLAATLRGLGAEVVAQRVFPDHHRYTRADLSGLDPALRWITTAKDAVKIPALWAAEPAVSVLGETVRPHRPGALADFIEARLDASAAEGASR